MIEHLYHKGVALIQEGRLQEALLPLEVAVMQAPEHCGAIQALAVAFMQQHRYGIAIPLLQHVQEIGARNGVEYPDAWNNLGGCYRNTGAIDRAKWCYERAVEIYPQGQEARINLTGLYINEGAPERVLEACENAPQDDARVQTHRAIALLEMGRLADGWAAYDARFGLPKYHKRAYACPLWDGQPVDTLAVHGEQGIGDEILFAAWLPEARKRCRRLVIECEPRLVTLFARSFDAECYGTDEALQAAVGPVDAYVPFGTLPRLLGALPPPHKGYLRADAALVEHYRAKLRSIGAGPYTGFAWSGGTMVTHQHLRNPELEHIQRIITAAGGTGVSVQYGGAGEAAGGLGLAHWQQAIDSLDDQAALIAALDCVITVCQTAVHVAGSQNVPVWVLCPKKAAWRYGLTGERMPWYPSARVFRQARHDDWSSVADAVCAVLERRAAA